MAEHKLPYLPEGKEIKYVPIDNQYIFAAAEACRELTGCYYWPTGAVVVNAGEIIGIGANSGELQQDCPRLEHNCATGEGYHFCKEVCQQHDHAEVSAIKYALKKGFDPNGADLYLFGHWWCCQNCWNFMIQHGIKDVYLLQGADGIFTKENRLQVITSLKPEEITRQSIAWRI